MSALYDIRARCTNPNHKSYPQYGGRGIRVCPQWLGYGSIHQFELDMGPRPTPAHSVDRIDNDGDYSPENCRWATPTEQQENSSQARTIRLKAPDGSVQTFPTRKAGARAMGFKKSTAKLYDLLDGTRKSVRGWTLV